MTHHTFNAFHLGDNLLHLHFLRKLALAYPDEEFVHAAQEGQLWQLRDVVADIESIRLVPIREKHSDSLNAWRGVDNWFYHHRERNNFVRVHLDWFALLAERMGFVSPIKCAADLVFDYPALKAPAGTTFDNDTVLFVNSRPLSGQWTGYNGDIFDEIATRIREKGFGVVTTNPQIEGRSVTHIGQISQHCRAIVGVATGPIWPTFNVWNRGTVKLRVLLNDHERVDIIPETTVYATSLFEVPKILHDHAYL